MTISERAPQSAGAAVAELSAAQKSELDADIRALTDGAAGWARMPLDRRAVLLREVHASVSAHAADWAHTAAGIKGLAPESPLVGEEWMSGPYAVLSALTVLAETVEALASGHSPIEKLTLGTAPGGRVTVPVMPYNAFEGLLLHGFHGEVWLKPGVTATQARGEAGLGELTPTLSGGVGLVLGRATSPRSRLWTCCTRSSRTIAPRC
jgi:hypothetical protein